MSPRQHEITQLLRAWRAGDKGGLDRLAPLVYDDLHRLDSRRMAGERDDHTLQTTALVHGAYVRLVDSKQATWKDRAHFFVVCARLMRRILVDAARSRRALKRGGDPRIIELDEAMPATTSPAVDLINLDDARVIEMRCFAELSVKETAEALQVSADTVTRDMQIATAWLQRELCREDRCGT
jgi:RNA polymerase sigma factor (TIGR02999 family)